MRILILGGTGFIGPHQVRYALARGHQVTLFNRGRQAEEWPGHVEELIGDRNGDLKGLAGREWDVCIDNPTTLPVWVRDVGRVLAGKVKQYIFISTISVYAASDKPADETAALAAYTGADPLAETAESFRAHGELYGPLKAASELEASKQFGQAVTVIRPGLIVGPGDETDRFSYWPVRLANDGKRWGETVLAPGDGNDPVQFIDARDLAEWIIRMAEARTFGTFNATGPASRQTMRDARRCGQGRRDPSASGLGADALPPGREGLRLGRYAGVDSGPGRHPRLPPPRHPPRARRRPDLSALAGHRGRHPGLVPQAARGTPGEAALRAHADARSGASRGPEDQQRRTELNWGRLRFAR